MKEEILKEILIQNEADIVATRRAVREAAAELGFSVTDTTRIVTAVSELARNIFKYAGEGTMIQRVVEANGRVGLELKFEDQGPGIPDIAKAMEEGFSTGGGYGLGLPGVKRLMDEMDIQSVAGHGTTVVVKKWKNA